MKLVHTVIYNGNVCLYFNISNKGNRDRTDLTGTVFLLLLKLLIFAIITENIAHISATNAYNVVYVNQVKSKNILYAERRKTVYLVNNPIFYIYILYFSLEDFRP